MVELTNKHHLKIVKKQPYDKMVETLKNINLARITEEQDDTDLKGELACAGGVCEIRRRSKMWNINLIKNTFKVLCLLGLIFLLFKICK